MDIGRYWKARRDNRGPREIVEGPRDNGGPREIVEGYTVESPRS
jgi:hypothetical protein